MTTNFSRKKVERRRKKRKKTEHTNISHTSRSEVHKIFTSCFLLPSWLHQKPTPITDNSERGVSYFWCRYFWITFFHLKEYKKGAEKKNGAHKHRYYFKKLGAQNIHVMLSYAKNLKQTRKINETQSKVNLLSIVYLSFVLWWQIFDNGRKKTEHTIISRTFRNSERQNIHVMLSYAIIAPTKQTINTPRSSKESFNYRCMFIVRRNFIKEKKRSTQSSLTT